MKHEAADIPVVSKFHFYRNALNILKNPLPFHHKNFEKLGDTFQLETGFYSHVVFSRDPELFRLALQKKQKNFRKSYIQTYELVKYVGHGLLTSEGEEWKTQRKLLQPTFHKKNIAKLTSRMYDSICELLDHIEPDTSIDSFPIFNDLAFKVVARSLFSDAINDEQIKRLQFITEETQMMLVKELRQPYKRWWFTLSGELRNKIMLSDEARDIITSIIKDRRQAEKTPDDLLDMLMSLTYDDGSVMEQKDLLDEILILFIAGHETTSNALTFTAQLLAHHPEYQRKIKNEALAVPYDTIDHILQHTRQAEYVINESMRLYPPVYFIDRMANAAFDHKGLHFQKDTTLLFSLYEMHRLENKWQNPQEFKPERFSTDKNFSDQFFPFGAGPRKCIGNNFAMVEMKLVVYELMKRFDIEPVQQEIDILPLISLKPKNAFLKFKKAD